MYTTNQVLQLRTDLLTVFAALWVRRIPIRTPEVMLFVGFLLLLTLGLHAHQGLLKLGLHCMAICAVGHSKFKLQSSKHDLKGIAIHINKQG